MARIEISEGADTVVTSGLASRLRPPTKRTAKPRKTGVRGRIEVCGAGIESRNLRSVVITH